MSLKSNWNPDLENLTRRPDRKSVLMLEGVQIVRGDLKQTQTQWNAADSLTGLVTGTDGTVTLAAGALSPFIEETHNDTFFTNMDMRTGSCPVLRLELGGNESDELELYDFMAYLDPVNGGAKQVAFWELHFYASDFSDPNVTRLVETSDPYNPMRVAAGSGAADVVFDFSTSMQKPKLKKMGALNNGSGIAIVYVEIRGIKADGSRALNIGWGTYTTDPSVTTSGNVIKGYQLTDQSESPGSWERVVAADQARTPRCRIRLVQNLVSATIAFTGANKIDLGAVPTGVVEFVGWAETPVGSSVTYQVRNDADSAWVTYVDGDTNVSLGISARQTYKMQAILAPGGSLITPILHVMGAQELASINFYGLVKAASVSWSADPIEGKGEIAEGQFLVMRDGETDYRDLATEFLVGYDAGSIYLRLWLGHPTASVLPRSKWCLLATYTLEDWYVQDDGILMIGSSPLTQLKRPLPNYNVGSATRQTLIYQGKSLKFVWDDLISGQLALPGRLKGPGVEDNATLVSKQIIDSDGKEELNAISYLAGGTAIEQQGRVCFVDLHGPKRIDAVMPLEEVNWVSLTPGLSLRRPEFFIKFGYSVGNDRYDGEIYSSHATALTKLGATYVDPPHLSDTVAKWIPTSSGTGIPADPFLSTLASAIGTRHTQAFGLGMITGRFRTTQPYPELQIGSMIAVQTDKLVARDVQSARAIRGLVWVLGVVTAINDVWHSDFTIWVRSYADILSGTSAASRLGFALPTVIDIAPTLNSAGVVTATLRATDAATVRIAVSTSAFPTAATVRATGALALDAGGNYASGTLATLAMGQKLYISALAYEKVDGTGSESAQLMTVASGVYDGGTGLGRAPTVIVARKSSSAGGGNPPASAYLAGLGLTVTTSLAATVTQCRDYDIVVIDCDAWDAGEHNTFIQDLWRDGQKVWVAGNDSTTTLFYVTSSAAATPTAHAQPYRLAHPINAGWTDVNDADNGQHITGFIGYARQIGKFSTGDVSILEVPHSSSGGTVLHSVRFGIGTPGDGDTLALNTVRWLVSNQRNGADALFLEIVPNISQTDGSGTVRFQSRGAGSYRYVAVVGTGQVAPAWPTDAAVLAGTLRTFTGGVDTLTIAAGTVPAGQTLRVRAIPLQDASGAGAQGEIVGEEFTRITDFIKPYPRPSVRIRSTSGSNDATSAKMDIVLSIGYTMGPSTNVTLKVWTSKASTGSPDPSATYEGSATIALDGSGLADVAAATTFNLSGGGTDTLLTAVRVSGGLLVAKRIYAQVIAADGMDTGVIQLDLPGRLKNIIDSGIISSSDDAFIASGNTLQVGTSGSPSSKTKTLRFSHVNIAQWEGAAAIANNDQACYPTAASTAAQGLLILPIPVGVTITVFRASMRTVTGGIGGDRARVQLFRQVNTGGGAPTQLADLDKNAGTLGWTTESAGLSELTTGICYHAQITLIPKVGSPRTDTEVEWVEIDYTMPDYAKGY